MKIRRICLALLQLSGVFYLTNCMGKTTPANTPGEAATISVSPQPISIAAGATVTFTATTTNASGYMPTWELSAPAASSVGTLSATSGNTITYTAPSTPPIYNDTTYTQGTVTLQASVENVAGCDDVYSTINFIVTSPTVTVGLSPATASVAVGPPALNAQSFTGYAVGSTNGALTWQVNGVTGGSTTFGSINPTGTLVAYTPPLTLPISGNPVTITVISQADPTKTATATITLH
jgi:hypothetical protein